MVLAKKLHQLREEFRRAGQVILAFSGGVDSTLLACIGQEELGENFQAITVDNGMQSRFDLNNACCVAAGLGISHKLLEVDCLKNEQVRGNTIRRCYYCKKIMMKKLLMLAADEGSQLIEGSHAEDLLQYRPGQQALLELGVISPLQKVSLTKREIRQLARDLGMPNWEAPASPCLATRFSYGETLSPALLRRVEAAENIIRQAGFRQFRVRVHQDLARIEVEAQERIRFFNTDFMDEIERAFRTLFMLAWIWVDTGWAAWVMQWNRRNGGQGLGLNCTGSDGQSNRIGVKQWKEMSCVSYLKVYRRGN